MKCVSILGGESLVVPPANIPKICQYIDDCPQCSCAECEGVFVAREAGRILCCTMHMFTKEEIAMARQYAPPIRVVRE